jgi:predicted MPP superfamily phosphohydrolase
LKPLRRSPRYLPRAFPVPAGRARRLLNFLNDLIETAGSPFARGRGPVVETVVVEIAGLPAAFAGYTIAFLSDFHASPLLPERAIAAAVELANAQRPDLIALGGDFVSSHRRHIARVCAAMAALRAPDGVAGVLGNHDHYLGPGLVREGLERAGVQVLTNRALVVERAGARLAIAGVDDLIHGGIDFESAVSGIPPEVPRVVLSHHPDVFALWPAHLRLDLMLSGHTHGGQVKLPFLGAPYVPSYHLYGEGLIRDGGRQLYVSRGIGSLLFPIRWGCPPEISVIRLAGPGPR